MHHSDASLSRRTLLALLGAISITNPSQAKQPILVTTSFSILADWVQIVGANRVQVTSLVGPNQDAHVFEPKPQDVKRLQLSQLFVINGQNFEPWAERLVQSAPFRGTTLIASRGVTALNSKSIKAHHHAHHGVDPHAWQNPLNAVLYVQNIANALSTLDPEGRNIYQNNAQAYEKALKALDAWAHNQFASIPVAQRKVITSHDAFTYFAARYNIQFIAAHGLSTAAQPSAKQVAQLIRQIQSEKIKTIFVENMSNPKLMQQISQETGAKIGAKLYSDALSQPGEPGANYLDMMRHNITHLAQAMQ